MNRTVPVADLDRMLDELEKLTDADQPAREFFGRLLGRLALLLQAKSAAILMPSRDDCWIVLAAQGDIATAQLDELQQTIAKDRASAEVRQGRDGKWLACPVRRGSWDKGALWVGFNPAVSAAAAIELEALLRAFAEIVATRRLNEQEAFLDSKWPRLQQATAAMMRSESADQAGYELVNSLAGLLEADRVSLMRPGGLQGNRPSRVAVISGVARIDQRAALVRLIRDGGSAILRSPQPVIRTSRDAKSPAPVDADGVAGLFPQQVGVRLGGDAGAGTRRKPNGCLLLEWREEEAFLRAVPLLNQVLPQLDQAWTQQVRWLGVPRLFRRGLARAGGTVAWRVIRWAIILAALASAAWWLSRPVPLRIEARGTLQPVGQRGVHVSIDGFVEELLVEDGQTVAAGQPLVRLRSPELEMQRQELRGQLTTLAEKRESLNVELIQTSPDNEQAARDQNRLAAEIRLLDIEVEGLEEKRKLLDGLDARLLIESPVAGSVVAPQLRRFLDGRPVRRGDLLFHVVDFDGPWRLELMVPDGESGHVRNWYNRGDGATAGSDPPRELDWVLASQPEQWQKAEVTWISGATRHPDGSGAIVDVFCLVDRARVSEGHMGATVHAWFPCGQQPFWFVWSRRLIESAQRRFWF
jgi:multidrug efflux pump subunit AcrA (membrane-fusion protein)